MTDTTTDAMRDAREVARGNTRTLDRATDYLRGVLDALTHDDLRRPTPCDSWDAGRVAVHLADVIDGLIALLETGELALPQPPRTEGADPLAVVDGRLAALAQAFTVADDAPRVQQATVAGAIEFTTHGWDIGVAVDPAHRIPDALARDVLALVTPILDINARGENFALPIDLAQDASASDRLAAFLGRTPRRQLPD